MGLLNPFLIFALVLTTVSLIGLILIQRGKGGGLAGAFGGGGVEQAFGTRATTLAQKATAVLGILYLVFSITLGIRLAPAEGATPDPDTSADTADEPPPPPSSKPAAAPVSSPAPAAPSTEAAK